MSKLETGIAEWRARMSEALPQRNEALDEMEEHLREHVASLQRAGKSDDEALLVAREAMGAPGMIAREYDRVTDDWRPGVILLRVLTLVFACLMGAKLGRLWHHPNIKIQLVPILTLAVVYLILVSHTLIATGAFLQAWRHPMSEREGRSVSRLLRKLALLAGLFVPINCGVTLWQLPSIYHAVPWLYYIRVIGTLAAVAALAFMQSVPAANDRARWLRAVFASLLVIFVSLPVDTIPVAGLWVVFILGIAICSINNGTGKGRHSCPHWFA